MPRSHNNRGRIIGAPYLCFCQPTFFGRIEFPSFADHGRNLSGGTMTAIRPWMAVTSDDRDVHPFLVLPLPVIPDGRASEWVVCDLLSAKAIRECKLAGKLSFLVAAN
jgi:hypothetical protein